MIGLHLTPVFNSRTTANLWYQRYENMTPFMKTYELLVTVKLSYGTEENFYVQVTMSDIFYNSGMFVKEELFRKSIQNAVKKNLINPVSSVKSVHVTPFSGNKMLFRSFPNMTFL